MAETLLRTPFAPRNVPADAECIDVYGYAAPLVVTDPVDEYTAVRERVGVLDFSMLLKVDVRGPGAVAAVNGAVVRDLAGVAPGRIAYGPVVNDAGGMLDDSTCFVYGPDHVRVIGGPGMPAAIDGATAGKGLEVRHLREEQCHLTLQGPRSREVLAKLAGFDVSGGAFPYYTFRDGVTVAGLPVLVSRMGFTAELGYELYAPVERGPGPLGRRVRGRPGVRHPGGRRGGDHDAPHRGRDGDGGGPRIRRVGDAVGVQSRLGGAGGEGRLPRPGRARRRPRDGAVPHRLGPPRRRGGPGDGRPAARRRGALSAT